MRTSGAAWPHVAVRAVLVLYMAVLCLYSVVRPGTPGTAIVAYLPGRDLGAHFIAYGGLGLVLCTVFAAEEAGTWAAPVLALALGAALAGALEMIQAFVPWRTCSLADFAAGIAGVAAATGSWAAWQALRRRTSPRRPGRKRPMSNGLRLVDIHAHLLPGLDDGPATLDESLHMCELLAEQGVSTVIATPHMCVSVFPITADNVRAGVRQLSEVCRRHSIELEILPGGNVRLQPKLLEALENGTALTLADAWEDLLLELPPQGLPRIEGLVGDLGMRGITLILGHPERSPEFARKPECLAALVAHGCLVQVTGTSLLGEFGRRPKRLAEHLIDAGLVHVVASDAHSALGHRRPEFPRVFERLVEMAGEGTARQLLSANPAAIARGEELHSHSAIHPTVERRAL